MDKEKFMNKVKWISKLKWRASYGVSGNNRILDFGFLDLLYISNYSFGNGTGNVNTGQSTSATIRSNKDITWEKKANFNAGFDISLFDRRLNIEAEYFKNEVKDMLFSKPLPPSSGFSSIPENIGNMENKGFELNLDGDIIRGKKKIYGSVQE
jgi:outer membrane receptor protein involved in Fe transport